MSVCFLLQGLRHNEGHGGGKSTNCAGQGGGLTTIVGVSTQSTCARINTSRSCFVSGAEAAETACGRRTCGRWSHSRNYYLGMNKESSGWVMEESRAAPSPKVGDSR
jgi:hypothetical protein